MLFDVFINREMPTSILDKTNPYLSADNYFMLLTVAARFFFMFAGLKFFKTEWPFRLPEVNGSPAVKYLEIAIYVLLLTHIV